MRFQRTKLYDPTAGLPLVAWFGFSASRQAADFVTELDHAQTGSIDSVLTFQIICMRNEELVLATLFREYEGYRTRTARVLPGLY